MKTIPIKPEHRSELRLLLGKVFYLESVKADTALIAEATRNFGRRHLQLYPELDGKRCAFNESLTAQDVYDSPEEWQEAIIAQAKAKDKMPYVGFIGSPGAPVIGPSSAPLDV